MIVSESSPPSEQESAASKPVPIRARYRVRFAKAGLLRWISHRDLARLWERLVRRAALNLSMSEGFHPKPRIGFPSALALGVIGLDEVVELELAEELSPQVLINRLRDDQQPGLTIKEVQRLPEGFGKAQLRHSEYLITPGEPVDWDPVRQAIESLLARSSVSIQRKNKTLTVDVATQIPRLAVREPGLELHLAAAESASLRPGDVMSLLNLADWVERGATIIRTRVHLHREFESDDPKLVAKAPCGVDLASELPDFDPPAVIRSREIET